MPCYWCEDKNTDRQNQSPDVRKYAAETAIRKRELSSKQK